MTTATHSLCVYGYVKLIHPIETFDGKYRQQFVLTILNNYNGNLDYVTFTCIGKDDCNMLAGLRELDWVEVIFKLNGRYSKEVNKYFNSLHVLEIKKRHEP